MARQNLVSCPAPTFLKVGLVNNRWVLENATLNQITGLLPSHGVVQGVAMVSEVVATRSRGCEKTVGRGKPIKTALSITRQPVTADFSRTQNYVIIGQTHFSHGELCILQVC